MDRENYLVNLLQKAELEILMEEFMGQKIVSFIPIKLNNQRLPGKNLMLLNGRPLCDYIFDTIGKIDIIDEKY